MWYAKDNGKSRELVTLFSNGDVDADDTKYQKMSFWATIKNIKAYEALWVKTEFAVNSDPPRYFFSKRSLGSVFVPAQL